MDERVGSPGAARYGCWELNSATQQVLLTAVFFLHRCISLVSVAVVKHLDQFKLKKIVNLEFWLQRLRVSNDGKSW